jgi:hypothetical protein
VKEGRTHMGDEVSSSNSGPARRGKPSNTGASVLTPPVGIPAIPGQRQSGDVTAAPPVAPVAPPKAIVEPCLCGHAREAHKHFRRGTDCGACGAQECGAFKAQGGAFRKTMRRLGFTS